MATLVNRDRALQREIAALAQPLAGSIADYDGLLALTAGARCVLIGEATHGTHEFYRHRAELTKRLIVEQGFGAVAAEADWPDAYRVNRWVRGAEDGDSLSALRDFQRFPAWMWRNQDVRAFVAWLRHHNENLRSGREKVGFYGLDLYSLHASIDAVLRYLDRVDPAAAARARYRYGCFEHFGEDPQAYGYATAFDLSADCEREVVAALRDLQTQRHEILLRDGVAAEDEQFQAEQNARVVVNAERYYKAAFRGRISSWNLRDSHMGETLDALFAHLARRLDEPKIVVWAHNSHVGDARATELGDAGELDLGQLARQRWGKRACLIGLTTYAGTVTAASQWGGPAENKRVRPALEGSWEALLHGTGVRGFTLALAEPRLAELHQSRLERAIGVIYLPETERVSHYFQATLPAQFDALLHVDQTRAVEPLERTAGWERGELPETYPTGM